MNGLNAWLNEDETTAKAAIHLGDGTWTQGVSEFDSTVVRDDDASVGGDDVYIQMYEGFSLEQARYVARHDPARALREVEAKRQIIALCETETDQTGGRPLATRILHLLASIYKQDA